MTLCLAWKVNNDIFFASDSRITRKIDSDYIITTDTAPKIFSIPVRIYNPELNLYYDKDWGICLAGGYISGSGYADTLSEVLSNLRITDINVVVDYKNIINIAFNIYEQISKELVETGNKEALTRILISGICPNNENLSFLYEFSFEISESGVTYLSKEIDFNEYFIWMIGDQNAKKYFNDNLQTANSIDYFRILKEICGNSEFKTVGGNLQTGILTNNHPKYFSIFGIVESKLEFDEEKKWYVKNSWFFRSIELKPELFEGIIHIRKTFLTPFERERLDLIEEAKRRNELKNNKDKNAT